LPDCRFVSRPPEADAHHKEHLVATATSRHPANNIPDEVAPIAELMASFRQPWALCGGWAVDAWLGRQTRAHGDVDFCVWDQRALFQHLNGWQLVAHHPKVPGDASELWDGRQVELPAHIHGRRDRGEALPDSVNMAAEQGFRLDVQLNERSGDDWVLIREPSVAVSLAGAILESPWGVPAVAPEVLLFYKSLDLRRRDKLDFAALRPQLTAEQRGWLREAIAALGHPWLAELS
jgi:hypothetical protein